MVKTLFRGNAYLLLALIAMLSGCQPEAKTLFTRLSPDESGIDFQNVIEESPAINILNYEYTYNGGGVAAADFNNDGLCDLYFTGNTVSNRLYLNNGDLTFKDVTEKAGVTGRSLWKTGVTAADVNGDGFMDLYVCYSGPDAKQSLANELFINQGPDENGEPSFKEQAKEYGIDADGTYSTQASFFDYDRDGDLDMFLINHGTHFYSPFINTNKLRSVRHPQFGNRLYRNEMVVAEGSGIAAGNFFKEVSQEAGIHGGGLNFGLGVSISDVNNDSWPDIFVTNDYEEQDFLYLNNGNGTFKESTKKSFGHLSRNGMGTDIADFNNDGLTDLIEVDMWPEDNYRQKLLRGPDDFNRYTLMVDSGFHHQQMRNTLQMNAGVGKDGTPMFCEIGQFAGVSSTDWSWAPLFADLDNDGYKDIFIANGYLRDFTSMDFLKYTVEEAKVKARAEGKELQLYELVSQMPSTRTSDYVFRNDRGMTFSNATKDWGMAEPNLSFGAAYADLDNDGDLELITNNTNEPSTIWLNQSNTLTGNSFLRVKLKGPATNSSAVGAKVVVKASASTQTQEQYPTRGYQSSVDPVLHFGLGKENSLEEIVVIWPDGKQSILNDVKANQLVEVDYATAVLAKEKEKTNQDLFFNDVSEQSGIDFIHHENAFIDFDREPLLPYQLSRLGPALAVGDVNKDGSDDVYVGGASGQAGALYIADSNGKFFKSSEGVFSNDRMSEDTGATFFDPDSDGDLDLFVVSGGNEFAVGSAELDDRLYLNDGKGKFAKAPAGATVADHASGSCVTASDYDRDGDIDLYVGGRILPGSFPITTPGAILKNESNKTTIKFTVATAEVNSALREPGMVTDALWTDYNSDGWPDLLIVGDWMPVRLFENKQGKLFEVNHKSLQNTAGLWNRIFSADIDGDKDPDYVLGNAGTNLPWNVSVEHPLKLYYSDFNGDNRIDPLISYSTNGKEYPVASRDEMLLQMNSLRKKFIKYAQYGEATIEQVVDKEALDKASVLKVETLSNSVLENLGSGNFKLSSLPQITQLSSVRGAIADDIDGDGIVDLFLAGNFFPYRTQYGSSDAGMGVLLIGKGNGRFEPVSHAQTGFMATGDIRNLMLLKGAGNRKFIVIVRNNDKTSLIEVRKKERI